MNTGVPFSWNWCFLFRITSLPPAQDIAMVGSQYIHDGQMLFGTSPFLFKSKIVNRHMLCLLGLCSQIDKIVEERTERHREERIPRERMRENDKK